MIDLTRRNLFAIVPAAALMRISVQKTRVVMIEKYSGVILPMGEIYYVMNRTASETVLFRPFGKPSVILMPGESVTLKETTSWSNVA